MNRILFALLLAGIMSSGDAQSVQGILQDGSNNSPLFNATIKLVSATSSSAFTGVSNNKGVFNFSDVPAGKYTLTVTSIGYATISKIVTVGNTPVNLGIITTTKSARTLETVIIKGEAPTIKQNNDTMEFGASQYKVNPDATSEDLIKKMPGITVDKKTGSVTAMGETVQKVTVDGRDFFGDDATATLRNLPADIIDKIQVFDKLSDQAQLTGFDDGNTTKAINIVTKVNMRNGNFGRVYAGYGTDGRYSGGGKE